MLLYHSRISGCAYAVQCLFVLASVSRVMVTMLCYLVLAVMILYSALTGETAEEYIVEVMALHT